MAPPESRHEGLRVLVCPSGFKGSLQPADAARCIAAGIKFACPSVLVKEAPLVDGGEGFTREVIKATRGSLYSLAVTGPLGTPVRSFFGMAGVPYNSRTDQGQLKKTAIIEMCAAAGLSLIPPDLRDPGKATTFGVGELILAALNKGAERIVIGCGDSGTLDGGAGMLQALGAVLLDEDGVPLPSQGGGLTLQRLKSFDLSNLDPRIRNEEVEIEAAVNWENVLCGPRGQAHVFSAQKGADAEQTAQLATGLDRLAAAAGRLLGQDPEQIGSAPGSGASGGLGTAVRVLGGTLRPRYDVVAEYIRLDWLGSTSSPSSPDRAGFDLVVTGEGAIDDQTPRGKMSAEVARRARANGVPVLAIAGMLGPGAASNYHAGVDAFTSILQRPCSLEEAMEDAAALTTQSAECVMRILKIGAQLGWRGQWMGD